MKLSFKLKALAAAAALLVGGQAFAQTNIAGGASGDGSLFLNVWDQTNDTSYVLDLSAASVGGSNYHANQFGSIASGSASFTLNDANWTSFVAGEGSGDSISYNIVATNTLTGANALVLTSNAALGTGSGLVGGTSNTQLKNFNINSYISAVNASPSSNTFSLYVQDTGPNANDAAYFGSQYPISAGGIPNTLASLGTALNFYELTLNGTSGLSKAAVTTYAGTWDLTSAGLLTYGSAVPLPKSWILLLSGLLLMGVIARRGKSGSTSQDFPGAIA